MKTPPMCHSQSILKRKVYALFYGGFKSLKLKLFPIITEYSHNMYNTKWLLDNTSEAAESTNFISLQHKLLE
jgi:hypothetical protein